MKLNIRDDDREARYFLKLKYDRQAAGIKHLEWNGESENFGGDKLAIFAQKHCQTLGDFLKRQSGSLQAKQAQVRGKFIWQQNRKEGSVRQLPTLV